MERFLVLYKARTSNYITKQTQAVALAASQLLPANSKQRQMEVDW